MCNNDYVHNYVALALLRRNPYSFPWALFMVRLDSRNTIWRGRYLDHGRVVKWGFGPYKGWRP